MTLKYVSMNSKLAPVMAKGIPFKAADGECLYYTADDIIISTTQISKLYSVNPTTAVKAVSRLADDGILYKRPGIGMCVAAGAREKITARRRAVFMNQTIDALLSEAGTLGISADELVTLIKDKEGERRHD
jgi:DNA-binding transcriptional regulator YhcF (GntR family)